MCIFYELQGEEHFFTAEIELQPFAEAYKIENNIPLSSTTN